MQWQNGRRGQDGWGRWTRRRKWYRDAELVEVDEAPAVIITGDGAMDIADPVKPTKPAPLSLQPTSQAYSTTEEKMVSPTVDHRPALEPVPESDDDKGARAPKAEDKDDSASLHSTSSRSFFRPTSLRRKATDRSTASSAAQDKAAPAQRSRRASEAKSEEEVSGLGIAVEMEIQDRGREGWGVGDEARMSLE